jgi:hypothetical protein
VRTATPHYAITRHETTLDPDGGFDLTLESGLSTTLSILRLEPGAQLSVNAHPTILPGTNPWSFNLETARLEGTILQPSATSPLGNHATYECERGDVSTRVLWTRPRGTVASARYSYPPGRVSCAVHRPTFESQVRSGRSSICKQEKRAGSSSRIVERCPAQAARMALLVRRGADAMVDRANRRGRARVGVASLRSPGSR